MAGALRRFRSLHAGAHVVSRGLRSVRQFLGEIRAAREVFWALRDAVRVV